MLCEKNAVKLWVFLDSDAESLYNNCINIQN